MPDPQAGTVAVSRPARFRRIRFRIRTLLLSTAAIGLALGGVKIYLEGVEMHWLMLKLRYGNVAARRAAALDVLNLGARGRITRRRAQVLMPALVFATHNPDAACRDNVVCSLAFLAVVKREPTVRLQTLRLLLEAVHDRDARVRAQAMSWLGDLGGQDAPGATNALRSALSDPSFEVQFAAVVHMGILGRNHPAAQRDVALMIISVLESQDDDRVRERAA